MYILNIIANRSGDPGVVGPVTRFLNSRNILRQHLVQKNMLNSTVKSKY